MKKLILLSAGLFVALSLCAQKRDTQGLKKIEQDHDDDRMESLSQLAELSSLAQLGQLANLAELGQLAELGELAERGELGEISIIIPEITAELTTELSQLPLIINLSDLSNLDINADYVDYGEIIEEAMEEVRKELKDLRNEQ